MCLESCGADESGRRVAGRAESAGYSSHPVPPRYTRAGALVAVLCLLAACTGGRLPDPDDHAVDRDVPAPAVSGDVTLRTDRGERFTVYATGAADADRALVLFHEWWGLTDHIRVEADRYASLGYRVYAIDLYGRPATDNPRAARRYMREIDQAKATRKARAALVDLGAPERPVGLLGWCFGGGQALLAAIAHPELVSATVTYYGMPVTDPEALRQLDAPVLGIFATEDTWITPELAAEFEAAMNAAGRRLTIVSYEAGHAFANPSGRRYDSEVADEARAVTDAFLDAELRPGAGARPPLP